MPLRIGFDVAPGNSGPGRYVASITRWLSPDEFEPIFLCLDSRKSKVSIGASSQNDLSSVLPRKSRFITSILPTSARRMVGFVRTAGRMAHEIRSRHLDIFHTQNTGLEETALAGRLAKVSRVIGTFHVDPSYDLHRTRNGAAYRLMELAGTWPLHCAIAVSEATKRDWIRRTRIPLQRVVAIHNGIDPDRFQRHMCRPTARQLLGLPSDGLIIGGIGRLDEAKGFAYLIGAIAQVAAEFPTAILVIAGRGPLESQLRALAKNLGIENRVRFLGFCEDVQPVLDALDIFVMSSLCETLGYALLEAMATELPTIGTCVGGISEVIDQPETGIITKPKSSSELAGALRILLANEHVRIKMGHKGRERVVRTFSEKTMVTNTINLYRSFNVSRCRGDFESFE